MNFRDEVKKFYANLGGRNVPLGTGCAYMGINANNEQLNTFQRSRDCSYEQGIRFFDTSSLYGASEFRVGEFIRRIDRKTIFLSSKSPIPPELTPKEAALFMRQALRNSLERLGTDHLDLYLIHDVSTLRQVLPADGILAMLSEVKHSGLVRYFGLATRYHDLLETACLNEHFDAILTFYDYTPIDQSAQNVIELASKHNKGVLNASPLAYGLLTGPDPRTNPSIGGEHRRHIYRAGKVYDLCQKYNISTIALALQFPLRNPDISLTLTGPVSPEEVQAGITNVQVEIPNAAWQELRTLFRTNFS